MNVWLERVKFIDFMSIGEKCMHKPIYINISCDIREVLLRIRMASLTESGWIQYGCSMILGFSEKRVMFLSMNYLKIMASCYFSSRGGSSWLGAPSKKFVLPFYLGCVTNANSTHCINVLYLFKSMYTFSIIFHFWLMMGIFG